MYYVLMLEDKLGAAGGKHTGIIRRTVDRRSKTWSGAQRGALYFCDYGGGDVDCTQLKRLRFSGSAGLKDVK